MSHYTIKHERPDEWFVDGPRIRAQCHSDQDAERVVLLLAEAYRAGTEFAERDIAHHRQVVQDIFDAYGSDDASETLKDLIGRLQRERDKARESCAMACVTPADDCACAGCSYAAEKGGAGGELPSPRDSEAPPFDETEMP